MAPKVIVVGAGPGGLAASLMLAKAGIDVTVIEKSATVGGRTKVIERDGFKFDLGPTFFHYTEVIEGIFRAIGYDAREELNLNKLDLNYRLIFGQGGQLDCTSDLELMKEQISALSGPKDGEAFMKYVKGKSQKIISDKILSSISMEGVFRSHIKKSLQGSQSASPNTIRGQRLDTSLR